MYICIICIMCYLNAWQQEKQIERTEAMQDTVGAAVLGQADEGDNYTIPTGVNSEMQLMKDTQIRLGNTEMTTRDGSVRMHLIGKFRGCKGAVNQQVCIQSHQTY